MATSVSTRSYLIAGMAAISAGAIAVAPMQPVSQDLAIAPEHITSLAVGLAASIDPITPWINTIETAADNISGLFTSWAAQPFPIITQIISNQLTYLGELPNIGAILQQVVGNIGNAIAAPFTADTSTLDTTVVPGALPHATVWTLLPQIIDIPEILQPVLDFTTTYTSGVLIGLVGPVVAPVLALGQSISSAVSALLSADIVGALNELINIPANVVNAFLNGGPTLELTPLLNLIGLTIPDVDRIGITMGGLLSPGGSLFNTLDMDLSVNIPPLPTINAAVHGVPTGAIGSLIGLTHTIADAIAVTPAPTASARVAAAVAAPEAVEATSAVTAEVATATEAAPTAEVTAADVAAQTAAVADDDAPATSDVRGKRGRGGDDRSAGQDAPARSSSGKAAASRG